MIPWLQILEYIPVVFSDPGLEQEGIFEQFWSLLVYVVTIFLKYMWPIYGLTFIITCMIGKKWIKNIVAEKVILWVLLVEFVLQSIYVRSYFEGGIVLTFFLLVLQIQFLYPEIRLKCLERFFLFPGLLFAGIWVIGSNVDGRVMNMGILLMNLWAIPFLAQITLVYKKNIRIVVYIPAFVMFAVLFIIRCFDIYRDGSISGLTYQISVGGMKGIYTEENRGAAYEQIVKILRIETKSDDVIAVAGCNPWVYMESPARCGSYTTWKIEADEILSNYYKKIPERIPNVVVMVSGEVNRYESWRYSSHGVGMNNEESPMLDGILTEYINGYECIKKDGCILYKKCY